VARASAPCRSSATSRNEPQTTLHQLELRRLVSAADRSDSVVAFRVRVGQPPWQGATVAEVSGNLDDDAVLASFVSGANRTFDQDPLLAFRLLADIGLRAVSPAINDPGTAVEVLDAIVGLLLVLAPRDLAVGAINSPSGVTRIYLTHPAWADFVGEGLDELLVASRNSPWSWRSGRDEPDAPRRSCASRPPIRCQQPMERARAYLRAGRLVPPSKPDDPLPA
jgi:uncharacterized membrane protein